MNFIYTSVVKTLSLTEGELPLYPLTLTEGELHLYSLTPTEAELPLYPLTPTEAELPLCPLTPTEAELHLYSLTLGLSSLQPLFVSQSSSYLYVNQIYSKCILVVLLHSDTSDRWTLLFYILTLRRYLKSIFKETHENLDSIIKAHF